MDEKIKRVCNR